MKPLGQCSCHSDNRWHKKNSHGAAHDGANSSQKSTSSADPTPLESDYESTDSAEDVNGARKLDYKNQSSSRHSDGSLSSILRNFRKQINVRGSNDPMLIDDHLPRNSRL